MSWQIFMHSVRQVFGNMEGALRVSAVLTIAQIVITLTIGRFLLMDQAMMQTQMMEGNFSWGAYALTMVLLMLLALWIAVGWHRYVLTNEQPGIVPQLRVDRILGYLGKTLLIALLVVPVAMLAGIVVGLALVPLMGDPGSANGLVILTITGLLVYIPVGFVMMRLSTALPGVALGAGVSVFSGWKATAGHSGTILGLVVISIVASLLLMLPTFLVFTPLSIPAIIWQFATQWVQVMVGVSILTTLYGHYVEGRALV